MDREFANFAIKSSTPEELADNEFRQLLEIARRIAKFLQQVGSTTTAVSSAICASFSNPSNSADKITSIINLLDTASNRLKDAEKMMSQFNEVNEFLLQKNIIVHTHKKTDEARLEIKESLNQLHILLFGDSPS